MKLADAIKIRESLSELSADIERFSWGPSWEFANQRKAEALRLIDQEIQRHPGKSSLTVRQQS